MDPVTGEEIDGEDDDGLRALVFEPDEMVMLFYDIPPPGARDW